MEGTGASIEIKPDPKYTSIAEWCNKERKNGLIEQIKLKAHLESYHKEIQKQEQEKFRTHWNQINKAADQIERSKKLLEAKLANEEINRAKAHKLRQLAEVKIEKERMRKLNERMCQRDQDFDTNKRRHLNEQKMEIKLALDDQMKYKRERIAQERAKNKLVINS